MSTEKSTEESAEKYRRGDPGPVQRAECKRTPIVDTCEPPLANVRIPLLSRTHLTARVGTNRLGGEVLAIVERVSDAEVVAVETHMRADHVDLLPSHRLDFAEVLGHVRVKMPA